MHSLCEDDLANNSLPSWKNSTLKQQQKLPKQLETRVDILTTGYLRKKKTYMFMLRFMHLTAFVETNF